MPAQTGPLSRPYPNEAILSARAFLSRQGHDANTVKCAEGFNTPLWQNAIRPHLILKVQS